MSTSLVFIIPLIEGWRGAGGTGGVFERSAGLRLMRTTVVASTLLTVVQGPKSIHPAQPVEQI